MVQWRSGLQPAAAACRRWSTCAYLRTPVPTCQPEGEGGHQRGQVSLSDRGQRPDVKVRNSKLVFMQLCL